MKNILSLLLFMLSCITLQAQAKIKFSYDVAGNQTNRVYCSDGTSCEGTSHKKIIDEAVITEEIATDIEKTDATIARTIEVYPNPTKGIVILEWKQSLSINIATIVITNSAGMGTRELPFDSGQQQVTIDLSSNADGLYVVRFYLNNGDVVTKKIIKH